MLLHAVRAKQLGTLRPSIVALRQTNLLLPKRLAVRRAGVVLMWSAVGDVALDEDEVGCVVWGAEMVDRLCKPFRVVGVSYSPHHPAIREKARRNVFAEGEIGIAFDRYVIAVIDPAQVAEHLVTGKRGSLARHALHHIAIAADRINIVVEH